MSQQEKSWLGRFGVLNEIEWSAVKTSCKLCSFEVVLNEARDIAIVL